MSTNSPLVLGLTEDFAHDRQQQVQWQTFLRKNALGPVSLAEVLDLLRRFLTPLLLSVKIGPACPDHWVAGGDWH